MPDRVEYPELIYFDNLAPDEAEVARLLDALRA